MKRLSPIFLFILFTACSAKSTCDKVLNLSKQGKLFLIQEQILSEESKDYFIENPNDDQKDVVDNINIPQFIDTYEFIAETDMGIDTVKKTSDLNFWGKPGEESYETMKKYITSHKHRFVNDSVIVYDDCTAKSVMLEYIIEKKGIRSRQVFRCIKVDGKWGIFSAFLTQID